MSKQVPPSESCNHQTAFFGGSSCTVHNYPNNNGTVAYSQGDKLLVLGVILIVTFMIFLYFLCSKLLSNRTSFAGENRVHPRFVEYQQPISYRDSCLPKPMKQVRDVGTEMSDRLEVV